MRCVNALACLKAAADSPAAQADGHCLYRAIDDQLQHPATHSQEGNSEGVSPAARPPEAAAPDTAAPHGYQELRATAAGYMRAHAADFEPFVEQVRLLSQQDCPTLRRMHSHSITV